MTETAVPEIEPEQFEELFEKKMFLRREAINKIIQLSISELESLHEVLEAEISSNARILTEE